MPPKEKVKTESTELQVFNLENLNPALLPELATFKEIQLKVVAENPFIAITDMASRDLAKKYRTALKTARTDLEKQDKLISSKFNEAKTKAKSYIGELIAMSYPLELKQQNEINHDEAVLEEKRQEKARIEQQRIDGIKKEIEDYTSQWKTAINLMTFDSITDVAANFLESYTSFDTTILEEFEALFPTKVEELSQLLSDRTVSLTNAENSRLENIRLEQEASELRAEKARLESLARIAEAAEAKAKKEREDFEKEKAEFAEKQAIAAKKETFEKRKNILLDLGFQFDDNIWEERDFGTTLDGINNMDEERFENFLEYAKDVALSIKTPPTEKVEIPEILVPDLPTVNVCTPIMVNDGPAKNILSNLKTIEFTTEGFVEVSTWDDIEKDFKASGEKSYSVWLKNNYNVPTKL